MRTFALLPAAGASQRMGRPKLLLPLGGQTVLERVVTALNAAGVARTLVVVGPAGQALRESAERAGASVLLLPEATLQMRDTCERGLDWLEAHEQPAPDDGWLLVPADHPTLTPGIVQALSAAAALGTHSIIVPVHAGQRGHPVWLRWSHVAAIRALPAGMGLNQYIRQHASATLELPWPDAEILRDLDTPEDYARLLAEHEPRNQ
jgi:molybdenum cofactor cytidylyltransferase